MDIEEARRILEVTENSSIKQIRESYKRLLLQTHPDLVMTEEENTAKTIQLSEAYEFICEYEPPSDNFQPPTVSTNNNKQPLAITDKNFKYKNSLFNNKNAITIGLMDKTKLKKENKIYSGNKLPQFSEITKFYKLGAQFLCIVDDLDIVRIYYEGNIAEWDFLTEYFTKAVSSSKIDIYAMNYSTHLPHLTCLCTTLKPGSLEIHMSNRQYLEAYMKKHEIAHLQYQSAIEHQFKK